ncbi:ATP-binding protein [Nocardioides sp. L-11A]|uniref:ATP-binding protein n=1 Tax=Nocardioides sp. L-11A TaxID=3043848 RepID=UPI00249C7218|nr:ATP-binding protein [Nocardioides sp. L-11A]
MTGTNDTGDSHVTSFPDVVAERESELPEVSQIPVHISYEIIKLFSEGLYQSPQKAVEELVSNSYDADATATHVLLPDPDYQAVRPAFQDGDAVDDEALEKKLVAGEEVAAPSPSDPAAWTDVEVPGAEDASGSSPGDDRDPNDLPPLWVIDNGTGLDAGGFEQLWRVAASQKANGATGKRAPIGQFGIGKLAAYVLAWRLTHISKVDDKILMTSMNFRSLEGVHQYDNASPIVLPLRELTEEEAKLFMADIEARDPDAWRLLFGPDAAATWTAARLSDFKDLYEKLTAGRLEWVLRTGLPLHGDFQIWLDGDKLESSKAERKRLFQWEIGSESDDVATQLGLTKLPGGGIEISGIEGAITGGAELFEKRLTEGKSDQYNRSNGFFVRVRNRVVNLEDGLFGLPALNHATWSRFALEVDADGLRYHLLSSREGVRESEAIDTFRKYLLGVFNRCRTAYEKFLDLEQHGIDISKLLENAPSAFLTEPIVETVRIALESDEESYYFAKPSFEDDEDREDWFATYAEEVSNDLVSDIVFEKTGIFDRVVRYHPTTRRLVINSEHPFVEKMLSGSRGKAPAALFGSAEFLIDAILQDYGVPRQLSVNLLADRDKILRIIAGDEPSTAVEALRLLKSALTHETALERAVGAAFRVLGFEYERRGGNAGGTDGVLYARLGRGAGTGSDDFKIVYDAKQTNSTSVPADKIDFGSLETFRKKEDADFGFFIAKKYDGQSTVDSKVNEKLAAAKETGARLSLLLVPQLQRLVELHYQYGVPLTTVRNLFAEPRSVDEVDAWLQQLETELTTGGRRVPLLKLLEVLESQKTDELQVPSVKVARVLEPTLTSYPPEALAAALQAVSTIVGSRWIEVNSANDEVRLHGSASQIVAEVERHLKDMFGDGIDATTHADIKG